MRLALLAFFGIIVVILTATSSCQKKTDRVIDANILRIPLTSEVSTLDPAESYDTISALVVYQGYETLYEYHYLKRPYELRPLLAESMPLIEKNGTKYTIKIKKNIYYHSDSSIKPGRTVTSSDFVTQIKRLAYSPTKSNGWWLVDNKIIGINKFRKIVGSDFSKFATTKIKGLETPDEHTLIINLTEPNPQLMFALAMTFTSPIPLESVIHYKNNLDTKMIGTGPFQLKSWEKGKSLKMVLFDKYHPCMYPIAGEGDRYSYDHGLMKDSGLQVPFLKGIEFIIIKEATARWYNFMDDVTDLVIVPNDSKSAISKKDGNLKKTINDQKIQVQISPTMTYWWMAFNMKHKIIGKNLNLRRAMAHALNVPEYVAKFTKNIGQKANSIYHPGIPGYDPSHSLPYGFNISCAKKFMKKAGFPNGKGLPPLTYDVRGKSSTNIKQANFIKRNLAEIGIQINIVLNTFPEFLRKSKTGKLEIWQGGWTVDYPDAENILQLLITKNHAPGPNATLYSNKKFDKMFEKLKNSTDEIDKRSLMAEMEKIIEKDLPWVMQHYTRSYVLHKTRLRNFRHSDIIYNGIKYYKLSDEE